MSRPLRMGAAAAVISVSILLSRLLGLGRDALIAGLIGRNDEADLYFQAFLIPDFLNYLIAGAFLTITLIPILSRHLEAGDIVAASRAFTSVLRFVAGTVVALTTLMWLFADQLVTVVFPDVAGNHDRLIAMTRIILPAQVFLVIGAILMAVQYAHKRFLFPALAPLIYNLGIILGGLLGVLLGDPSPEAFLWGALGGAFVGNFTLQWIGARRTGTWLIRPLPGESSVREYLVLALPLMVGQSVAVLDEQFVRFFGQAEVGATSALSFARRLNMVPVGVIAQAAGVAAFPFLAGLAARGDNETLVTTTARAARNTVFVAAGAAAALVVLAEPAVTLIYRYGQFTAADAEVVASLLMIYALSIPAWGLHQILVRHFYAKRKMWTPVVIGTLFTILAVPIWVGLHRSMGVRGFALASTLVISGYALAMLFAWGRDSGWEAVRSLLPSIARGLAAALVAGVSIAPLVEALGRSVPSGMGMSVITLFVGGVSVTAVFTLVAFVLRSPELASLRRRAS
ncbi:MAG: murein biosynthesis integral membrane protein MurJ [Acidimicrobiia bacterium]|nr:murein biosynthesis integral membrane protein MurJ [Acidimicrobiia bacterium]